MFTQLKPTPRNGFEIKKIFPILIVILTFGLLPVSGSTQNMIRNVSQNERTDMEPAVQPVTLGYLTMAAKKVQTPSFKNGHKSFQSSIAYPYEAIYNGIEGQVVIQFVINESGQVVSPRVIKGIGGGCEESVIDALLKTQFNPGMLDGSPVPTLCEIPITFKLSTLTHLK